MGGPLIGFPGQVLDGDNAIARTGSLGPIVYNNSGSGMSAGDLVYPSGYDATIELQEVSLADADDPAKQAVWVLPADIDNGDVGVVAPIAYVDGLDTSGFSAVGSVVYLSATAGGITGTAPTGDRLRQAVGRVAVKHASTGAVQFDVEPPDMFGGSSLQDEAVTTTQMADLARGSILSGQTASDRPTALAAETDGYILVGDGTDLNSVAVSGDLGLTNAGVATLTADMVWDIPVLGTWAYDGDGARTNGAGLCGDDPVLTAAAYCKGLDGGTYADIATISAEAGYTANYQLLPDVPADGDGFLIGFTVPVPEIAFLLSQLATYTGDAGKYQYSDGVGSMADLTASLDNTDATAADGLRTLQQVGALSHVPAAGWVADTIDGVTAYWIKWVVTGFAAITQVPILNSVLPDVVSPEDGFVAPQDGTITRIRLSDNAATLHTAADVKFMLVNFTTGAHSGELTFAQDKRTDAWASLTLAVNDGDVLGVVCTQEDGTNEPSGVHLSCEVTLA